MLRLGFDLLFLLPGARGGRETYARELLDALRNIGCDLDITVFVTREAAASGDDFWAHPADRVVVLRGATASSRPRWGAGEVLQLPIAAARARVDVLHAPANVAPWHGAFARVLTLHDLLFEGRLTHRVVRVSARRADRLIAVSAAAREDIVRGAGVPRALIDVIPHGLAPARAEPDRSIVERLRPAGRPIVLTIGADLPHKNLDAALDGVRALPRDMRPLLVLAGRDTDGPRLRARVAELDLDGDVRLVGAVRDEELEALYSEAALLLSPSRGEGFGLTLLEAMARGVPVAASDIAASREVAGDAAIWFSPNNASSIAGAIRRAIDGGPDIDALRRAGRERAVRFSWASAAERTLETYERALHAAREGGRYGGAR